MKHNLKLKLLVSLAVLTAVPGFAFPENPRDSVPVAERETSVNNGIKKLLVIGDSMTGWMAERLNEYGRENGFEVAAIVWDGSTLSKWGGSSTLPSLIAKENPDAILVSLGMNEMFEKNPKAKFSQSLDNLKDKFGEIPFVWVGPPSWPGHPEAKNFDEFMQDALGKDRYFLSSQLKIPRQSASNPHPSRKGMEIWVDEIAEWLPENGAFVINTSEKPESGKISRPKSFVYKRMKEKL